MKKNQRILRTIFAIIIFMILNSCNKEFINECDSRSINYKPLKANFTMARDGNLISLFNNSNNAESYEWRFSDGTKSTDKNLVKTVAGTKPFEIKLIASNCGNYKKDSLSQTIDMNCTVLAPKISYPAGSSLNLCNGKSIILTSTACSAGSVLWSTGATSLTIDVKTAGSYSARCQGSCQTASSIPVSITLMPIPTIESVKGTNSSGLAKSTYNLVFNGKINFNSSTITNEVIEYGFVYLAGTIDPNGSKDKLTINLGKKTGTNTFLFSHKLDNTPSNKYSFRAYIKLCDSTTKYGAVSTTN